MVVPFAHDQFDNADRIVRMGCGRAVPRKRLTENRLATELGLLPKHDRIVGVASEAARHIRSEGGASRAAEVLIERFL